ncbi:MAG: double-strand break repair protein AddB [Sedimentitalea sp.]
MFEPSAHPRVFALPSGADFPAGLVAGVMARHAGTPEDLARVHLIVNTRRMARRLRDLFDQGPALLLPRISLVTELGREVDLPPAVPALRRRLELSVLVGRLLDQQPELAARASLYDLADSLADLMDEMQSEGVHPETIRALDVSDMSGHWARAQSFISIADQFMQTGAELDAQARQRRVVETLIARWQVSAPSHPVILAGSTGSRGTTLALMEAIAGLPQGGVVLPGFDFDQPDDVWRSMGNALSAEDHPQYRFLALMRRLDLNPCDVALWSDAQNPPRARNRLVSLSLRPAPVTDAWLVEGPDLGDLRDATKDITLLEAPSPRSEAQAIAMRLRAAAEAGQTAALITPDRMLTRRVSAALDRWGIVPDDSAGTPLHLSPPGRFLRHVADLFTTRLTGEGLMTLMKHPLCHGGIGRGDHLRHARDLELHLRRKGPPFPDAASCADYGADKPDIADWLTWLSDCFCGHVVTKPAPLADWVMRLQGLAERIAAGSRDTGAGLLWDQNAGQKALGVVTSLGKEAVHGGEMGARDFADLLGALLAGEEVRDRDAPDGRIMIWGTLEARVQGADLVILGGLNEGSWPEAARPDPWLNRAMRHQAGLLLPERRIGLSAHDYQQAVAAPEVWLARAVRSDDAQTVASRWLNRLSNLLEGLPEQNGQVALSDMRARGAVWLDWAEALEQPTPVPATLRPSPCPPVAARPKQLRVTDIKRLIRDPFAIYAREVLRLRPLDPLVREPDALLRGIVVHDILERFIKATERDPSLLNPSDFLDMCRADLARLVPWPTAQRMWQARLGRVAQDFVATERRRQSVGQPVAYEADVASKLGTLDFKLVGRADRVDRREDGALIIYDYKTGTPPSVPEQKAFDLQLLLEIAMAERDGFENLPLAPVHSAVFLGVGTAYKEVAAPMVDMPPQMVWEGLNTLIRAYFEPDQGYTARRMMKWDAALGDYDHLARFGEWDRASPPAPEMLT